MDLSNTRAAFESVVETQNLSYGELQEVIDRVCHEIEGAVTRLQSEQDPVPAITPNTILDGLMTELNAIYPLYQLQLGIPEEELDEREVELDPSISNFEKILEETLDPGISEAYRKVDFDKDTVDQIIRNHFYHESLFDIADCFITETGEPEGLPIELQFLEMHQILEALKSRNLEPALSWVSENLESCWVSENGGLQRRGSALELKLHNLQYLQILQKRGRTHALKYLKQHLSPFAVLHMAEIQKLSGCLLWADRLETSPYAKLIAPNHWDEAAEELKRKFCNLILDEPTKSPLKVALAAGIEALPALQKMANEMSADEWNELEEFPVPLEMPAEFYFYSIYLCPLLLDHDTKVIPLRMPCGHVTCLECLRTFTSADPELTFDCHYCLLRRQRRSALCSICEMFTLYVVFVIHQGSGGLLAVLL